FPRQVMEATAAELYINAVLHYLTAWVADVAGKGRSEFIWLPDYEKQSREPLEDGVRLTVIELGTEGDLHRIFSGLISWKTRFSQTDREELKWYFQNYNPALPESIPNKEVLAFVGALIPDSPALKKHIKTATDVLRLAVAMSGGDVSLAESAKFRNFTRRERRALLELLENCDNSTEDMLRWKGRWIRLGERLHPGEYRDRLLMRRDVTLTSIWNVWPRRWPSIHRSLFPIPDSEVISEERVALIHASAQSLDPHSRRGAPEGSSRKRRFPSAGLSQPRVSLGRTV